MSSAWGPPTPRAALLLGLLLLASTAVRGREAETLSSSEAVGAASPNSPGSQYHGSCSGRGQVRGASAQRSPGCIAHTAPQSYNQHCAVQTAVRRIREKCTRVWSMPQMRSWSNA